MVAKGKGKKCVNAACEWHRNGECSLFPGDFGFLTCKHADERTEDKKETKKKGKK